MGNAGLQVKRYRYLNRKTNGLDIDGLLADVEAAPDGSVFLLHACAHNPTGVDPSDEQWGAISKAILAKGHHVLMDCAYQGFARATPRPTPRRSAASSTTATRSSSRSRSRRTLGSTASASARCRRAPTLRRRSA